MNGLAKNEASYGKMSAPNSLEMKWKMNLILMKLGNRQQKN
jgi:hypothetical protein